MKLMLFSLRDKSTTNICFLPNNMQDLLTHSLQSTVVLSPQHTQLLPSLARPMSCVPLED